jgi:hypothetical protein
MRAAYIGSDLSVDLIAREFGVVVSTARRWAHEERWQEERKLHWGGNVALGRRVFAASLVRRVAEFLALEANDAVEHLHQLRDQRQKGGSKWTTMEHAAYARAAQIQSERARYALGMRHDETPSGAQEVSFRYLPPMAIPAQPPTPGTVTIEQSGHPDPKPGAGG